MSTNSRFQVPDAEIQCFESRDLCFCKERCKSGTTIDLFGVTLGLEICVTEGMHRGVNGELSDISGQSVGLTVTKECFLKIKDRLNIKIT